MPTPTLKYVAPTTPEDDLVFAPEPVVIYGVPSGGGGGSTAWNDITGKPSTFPPSAHTQAISTITGLQEELDSKADTDEIPTTPAEIGAATSAQGALADTAVQPSNPRLPLVMTQAAYNAITPVAGQVYVIQG